MSINLLKKTHKRTHDDTIEGSSGYQNKSDKLSQMLDDSISNAYKRPWHRLERGLRLNRLRLFVEEEKERSSLSQVEAANLLILLQKALDKKILNSKTTINYDMEKERIVEIKGLVSHREADGYLKYQFIEKKSVTLKRRPSDAPPTQ